MTRVQTRRLLTCLLLALTPGAVAMAQPPVAVTAADPASGERESVGLVVRITGKNFANGARVDFFRSGTSDQGGIGVTSAVVVSSTEITATLNIDADAALSLFDIRVTNQSGRSGKGSDLFQVVEKGARACSPAPSPDWLGVPIQLNDVVSGQPRYRARMGDDVAIAADLSQSSAFVVATNAGSTVVATEIRESSGAIAIVTRHVLPTPGLSPRSIALGHLNADGIPDIVAGDRVAGRVVYFLSSITESGRTYSTAIPIESSIDSVQFGADLAVDNGVLAVAQWGVSSGKSRRPGTIQLYAMNGPGLVFERLLTPSTSPQLRNDDGYGNTVRLADVTGDGVSDVIAGAGGREVAGLSDAGEVFIFPGPSFDSDTASPGSQPLVLRAGVPATGDHFGVSLGVGDADLTSGAQEVVAGTLWTTSNLRVEVRSVTSAVPLVTVRPSPGLEGRFGEPGVESGFLDGDEIPDVVVPAPDASCGGAVHVYLARTAAPEHVVLQRTADSNYTGYGSSVAWASTASARLLVVGEKGRTVGGVDDAGQVYVYRVGR